MREAWGGGYDAPNPSAPMLRDLCIMRVFALSDPHLSFGTPNKTMDRFGPQWVDHPGKMAAAWDASVAPTDLVLVPGDISWARKIEQAQPDLEWLAARPGTKVLLKGNHEHWWTSRNKVRAALPEGVLLVDGDALRVGPAAIGGSRLWDHPSIQYHDLIVWQGEAISAELTPEQEAAALKVWDRELGRLERALMDLDGDAPLRIALTHYPPLGPGLAPNEASAIFEAAGVQHVVFGHLHALDPTRADEIGGEARGVTYTCASCDFIDFAPQLITEL
ncbi:MAG: phosphohydrolase [Planctomycetota bacterium]|nr:MAG: phosphohydrolase [Planctomycetota bacterium]